MNNKGHTTEATLPVHQVKEFQGLVGKLYQCCQERTQYQSLRFELPDAELRCLQLFGEERYLTPKGIARRMNVTKSRVTKIVGQMLKRGLVQRRPDPGDSRGSLISLTPTGQRKYDEITRFSEFISHEILKQMDADERKAILKYLGILERSMESVKELME